MNDCSFEERITRGGSLPPPVPRPSAGAACSTIGSDHEWNDYDTATIQRQVTGTNIERSILISQHLTQMIVVELVPIESLESDQEIRINKFKLNI